MTVEQVAAVLKAKKEILGYTYADLREFTGISRNTYTSLFRGKQSISIKTMFSTAEALALWVVVDNVYMENMEHAVEFIGSRLQDRNISSFCNINKISYKKVYGFLGGKNSNVTTFLEICKALKMHVEIV